VYVDVLVRSQLPSADSVKNPADRRGRAILEESESPKS
jgi:hypothetical protein